MARKEVDMPVFFGKDKEEEKKEVSIPSGVDRSVDKVPANLTSKAAQMQDESPQTITQELNQIIIKLENLAEYVRELQSTIGVVKSKL